MNEALALHELGALGAILRGHFVFTSGKHGGMYINKDAVYPHTRETHRFCMAIAGRFGEDRVDTVIAPAIGGVILSQWTAHYLSVLRACEVYGVYAEKADPAGTAFVIKRGYDKFIAGKRVLVVEDVLNTGGSVRKVVDAVREIGGAVIGIGALCNRGGVTAQDVGDVPKLTALVNVAFDAWDEADCPLCRNGVPVNTDVGKGREYLARKRA